MSTELVAWAAFLVALALLGVAMGCNATLVGDNRRLRANALDSDRKAKRDRAEAAQLRKSNEAMRQHTAEHCIREAALKGLLAANGIGVVESPAERLSLWDEADLSTMQAEDAFNVEDIDWSGGAR